MAADFDVVIVGGGVTGTALLFSLARYTDIEKIALIEKRSGIAELNSHARNNSQTLHCGDIETNYSLDKALQVKQAAAMVVDYCNTFNVCETVLADYPKMVLAVGEAECAALAARYQTFKAHFPSMRLLNGEEIGRIEPALIKDRSEQIAALAIEGEYSAVNFQRLSQSFIEQARVVRQSTVELNRKVKSIERTEAGDYLLDIDGETVRSRAVVICAGAHSLLFAHRMGYGDNYACLPAAGSFYYTPRLLNGKVYTLQNDKLPFAAIHGDPDMLLDSVTRFGPTALVLPLLERRNYSTLPDFLRLFGPDRAVLKSVLKLLLDGDVSRFLFKNLLFELPLLGRYLFLRDVRKIIPSVKFSDLRFADNVGGLRPVLIDKKNHKLYLGEARIDTGRGAVFNMTPSPGATSCLYNAERDAQTMAQYLGEDFDQQLFDKEIGGKRD